MHRTHPPRRPWATVLLLVVTALLLALAAVVLIAPPAWAHPGGRVQASPPPWPAGAALPAMAAVAALLSLWAAAPGPATAPPWPGPRRDPLHHPDSPGGS
jgi:hypothetical protein